MKLVPDLFKNAFLSRFGYLIKYQNSKKISFHNVILTDM